MIRFKPLPEDIEQRLPLAAEYLRSHPRVVFAYLFGGLARGERRPLSDVDIAVWLADTVGAADAKLDILGKMIGILGTDEIDLVILNTASPALAMNVLRKKQVVADNNPAMRQRFESLAFKKYFDFLPVEQGMLTKRVAND
jgi:uncharacterized protein